ncbi:MAG: hypothetical protein R3C20_20125 [Planctomycetaceae bacterium]
MPAKNGIHFTRLSNLGLQFAQQTAPALAAGAVIARLSLVWLGLNGASTSSLIAFILALSVAFALLPAFCAGASRLLAVVRSKVIWMRHPAAIAGFSAAAQLAIVCLMTIMLTRTFAFSADLMLPSLTAASESIQLTTLDSAMFLVPSIALMSLIVLVVIGTYQIGFKRAVTFELRDESADNQENASFSDFLTVNDLTLFVVGAGCLLLNVWESVPLNLAPIVLIAFSLLIRLMHPEISPVVGRSGGDKENNPMPVSQAILSLHYGRLFAACVGFSCGACLLSGVVAISWPLVVASLLTTVFILRFQLHSAIQRFIPGSLVAIAGLLALALLPVCLETFADQQLALKSSGRSAIYQLAFTTLPLTLLFVAASFSLFSIPLAKRRPALKPGDESRPQKAVSPPFGSTSVASSLLLLAAALVFVAYRGSWAAPYLQDVTVLLTLSVLCLAIGNAIIVWLQNSDRAVVSEPSGRIRASLRSSAVSIALVVIVVASCFYAGLKAPDMATLSRMVFSDRAVVAVQLGVSDDLITHSDASRLVEESLSHDGPVTVWRRSAKLLEFRRNGELLGHVSTDTELTPQPIEEMLPAILPLTAHPSPHRILLLGDDGGVCLKTCQKFPVRRVVAIRTDLPATNLARKYTWKTQEPTVDQDQRITIRHASSEIALHQQPETAFDVVIDAQPATLISGQTSAFSAERYQTAKIQLSDDGIYCQRLVTAHLGANDVRRVLATAMSVFDNVVLVQSVPGDMVLMASKASRPLPGDHILSRLQQDFVRAEIATAGWDWAQVAILPMLDANDPLGVFNKGDLPSIARVSSSESLLQMPLTLTQPRAWQSEMQQAFAAYEMRIGEAVDDTEMQHEVKRRLTALSQQVEILAGMPDEPWTYRKSLRVEMQRSPRPPVETVSNGKIVRSRHPTDQYHLDYFRSLSNSIRRVMTGEHNIAAFESLDTFTARYEPLLSLFAHYEIVRLHEMADHPAPADEFRHRLHTVYFTEASDASVRPVVAALTQLVDHPDMIPSDTERYDMLNSLVQKLIERWEARTAWEPRSAIRVQNDVDQSVRATNRAVELMEELHAVTGVSRDDFLNRRRYVNAALISPLRQYRDQVLAHRMKTAPASVPGNEDPDDLPMLVSPDPDTLMSTN